MEAVGSTRLGRASSRYGAPAVFSGPVRKWKKKWVHVSSPISSSTSHNNNSHSHNTNNNASTRLLLRRWTPITAPTATADDPHNSSGTVSDEPPRRKFRYTPIAVLEEQKKAVIEKAEYEPTTESDHSLMMLAYRSLHKQIRTYAKQSFVMSNSNWCSSARVLSSAYSGTRPCLLPINIVGLLTGT